MDQNKNCRINDSKLIKKLTITWHSRYMTITKSHTKTVKMLLYKGFKNFVGSKVILKLNINVPKGLVYDNIYFVTEIFWPHFRLNQV